MGRKGALVLLAVVALWAAVPALACLMPSAHRSCCQSMAMQDCGSQLMLRCSDCCTARPADLPLLPNSTTIADHAVRLAQEVVPAALVLPPASGQVVLALSEAPPLDGSPGAGSVLRI